MRLFKFAVLVLFLGTLGTFLFASGSTEGKGGKVTITFMSTEADLPADFVKSFNEKTPDINLVRTEEDWTKWVAQAMAGNAPDLNRLDYGTDVAYYVNHGLLYDMTNYLKKSQVVKWDDIDKVGDATYEYDGKNFGAGPWYGLPKDLNNIGMITYNKDMFKAAGIPMLSQTQPITYGELYTLGKKLTKTDANGHVLVWGVDVYSPNWIKFLISDMATAEGLSLYSNADRSKMNNDPRVRDLFKYWARFAVDNISSNVRNPDTSWAGAAFQSDRVAIVQLGYWFGAQLMENKGYAEKYGWAPTPIVRAGAPRVTDNLGATGIVMYKKTKHPDQAFRVFEWYIGGDYGIYRAKTGWGIPPLFSLRKLLPANNEYNKSRLQIALDDFKYMKPWQASPYITAPEYDRAWANHIDDLVKGNINYDQFVNAVYADLDQALARGKQELGG